MWLILWHQQTAAQSTKSHAVRWSWQPLTQRNGHFSTVLKYNVEYVYFMLHFLHYSSDKNISPFTTFIRQFYTWQHKKRLRLALPAVMFFPPQVSTGHKDVWLHSFYTCLESFIRHMFYIWMFLFNLQHKTTSQKFLKFIYSCIGTEIKLNLIDFCRKLIYEAQVEQIWTRLPKKSLGTLNSY